ncbi:hypothetical protein [Peribacillus frigoritolerans]|uniref:hypothetical protein n=1 Tax=Peribacillus frigoritolerans TaxID=450367 RepID=UPI00227F7A18|nr:hypothetical protein [Peribacillus frigoritolerans]MCY9141501.1 hypothetical protein [Peribacillus frigoritolerans]
MNIIRVVALQTVQKGVLTASLHVRIAAALNDALTTTCMTHASLEFRRFLYHLQPLPPYRTSRKP